MPIAGYEQKLDGLRTRAEAMSGALLSGEGLDESYQLIAMERNQPDGGVYALIDRGQQGIMERWIGERKRDSSRLYRKDVRIHPYADTLELREAELIEDTVDALNGIVDQFFASQSQVYTYKTWEAFLANPTGIDGVALLDNSHPYGDSGATWDNLTTDALSLASYQAGRVAMYTLKGEKGRFLRLRPDTLVVGPALEQTAREIVGADRVAAINASGAEATSSVLAAATRSNVFQGSATVVVVEHFANGTNDNDWFLMDSTHTEKPMVLVKQGDIRTVDRTAEDTDRKFNEGVLEWGADARFGIGGAYPHVVYGRLS